MSYYDLRFAVPEVRRDWTDDLSVRSLVLMYFSRGTLRGNRKRNERVCNRPAQYQPLRLGAFDRHLFSDESEQLVAIVGDILSDGEHIPAIVCPEGLP
jgi:hypothetical protein